MTPAFRHSRMLLAGIYSTNSRCPTEAFPEKNSGQAGMTFFVRQYGMTMCLTNT